MILDSTQFSSAETTTIPKGISTPEVVARCRRAALAFVNGAERWTPRQLADWLSGPYLECLGSEATPLASWTPIPLLQQIDSRMVARLLQVSNSDVRAALDDIVSEGGRAFGLAMVSSGLVLSATDSSGCAGYVPTREARRLSEMVLGLLGADYLTRPSDYELELATCRYCGIVEFSLDARTRGHCHNHESAFGFRRSGARTSLFPEGA